MSLRPPEEVEPKIRTCLLKQLEQELLTLGVTRHLHCGHCRQRCVFASDSRVRSARCGVRARLALQSSPGCASVRHEKHTALTACRPFALQPESPERLQLPTSLYRLQNNADKNGRLATAYSARVGPLAGRTLPGCSRCTICSGWADDECRTLTGWTVQLLALHAASDQRVRLTRRDIAELRTSKGRRTAGGMNGKYKHPGTQKRKVSALLGLRSQPPLAAAPRRPAPAAELPSLRRRRAPGTPCLGIC